MSETLNRVTEVEQASEALRSFENNRYKLTHYQADQLARAVIKALPARSEISVNNQLLSALEALMGNIGAASLSRNPVGRKLRADADSAILAAKLGIEEITDAQMDAEDGDPADAAYAKGYADGYKAKATERESGKERLRKLKISSPSNPEERAHNHAVDSCIAILMVST